MKITFILRHPFPNGMASSNRVASITRGLAKLGVDTTVVMPESPEPHNSKENLPDNGVWEGVKYVHLQGRKRNPSKILRALAGKTRFRFMRGVNRLKRWLKNNPSDVVFIYTDNTTYLEQYVLAAKSVGAKVLFNFDEYPTPIREQGAPELPAWKREKYKEILANVDGYVAINNTLARFYNDIVEKPTLEMSMVVDTDRFDGRQLPRKEQLTYMGQILPDKDNVANIIQAVKLLENKYPNLTFHIYGKASQSVECLLRRLVVDLGLTDKVFFDGFAPKDEVPNIMAQSKILVSSQPDNDRVRGCLSTKLAEYVAMATPTLMCDVGENRSYLSDNDCFFAMPDSPQSYCEILSKILDNYNIALSVANNGRKTICEKYSYIAAAKSLKKFCETDI